MSYWKTTQRNKLVRIMNFLESSYPDFVDSATIAKAIGYQTKDVGGMLRGRDNVEQIKGSRATLWRLAK